MYKRLSILPGIAILAVILNHAGGWGLVAMINWTHRYRPVTVPNYDQINSLTYYITIIIHQFTIFAVPAFLFVSGFFIAYATRGAQGKLTWKTVWGRIFNLLIPYLIWSVILLVIDFVDGDVFTPGQYLLKIVLLGANGGYFFIPVLITFYALSPFMVDWAKKNWQSLLVVAALITIIPLTFRYLRLWGGGTPLVNTLVDWTPDQLFFRWGFYFPLGVVAGLKMDAFKQWLAKAKWWLLGATVVFLAANIIEAEVIMRSTPDHWRPGPSSIFFHLYATSILLTFFAFEQVKIPLSSWLMKTGTKSFGIYLVHFTFMQFTARVIYHVAPMVLGWQIVLQPLLFAVGLAASLALLWVVQKSPLRGAYRYLFG